MLWGSWHETGCSEPLEPGQALVLCLHLVLKAGSHPTLSLIQIQVCQSASCIMLVCLSEPSRFGSADGIGYGHWRTLAQWLGVSKSRRGMASSQVD
jgi:hypothetical protein